MKDTSAWWIGMVLILHAGCSSGASTITTPGNNDGSSPAGDPEAGDTTVPPAPGTANSRLHRLTFTTSWVPDGQDTFGEAWEGTELMHLLEHKGLVFAATGVWQDSQAITSTVGGQILVKEAAGQPWRVDRSWPGYLRLSGLLSATFKMDYLGNPLAAPVTILLASPQDVTAPYNATVWCRDDNSPRDDNSQRWISSTLVTNVSERDHAYARVIRFHKDRVTDQESVFAGVATSALYRGGYDPGTGCIRWEDEPELTGSGRMHSGAEANGELFIAVGSNGVPTDKDGGLFKRIDGPSPSWDLVYEWPTTPNKGPGLRGLTAITQPGATLQTLLGAREDDGIIDHIDPTQPAPAAEDFGYKGFFTTMWGSLGGGATLAAYNDMLPVTDPDTQEPVHLIGVFVNHPGPAEDLRQSTWYLVRHADGTYDYGRVFDPARPTPGQAGLRATRTILASPFPEERNRVFYFGGYDGGGASGAHRTAWIYRGELPDPL